MKRTFDILFAAAVLLFCFASCKEDFVERPVTNREQAPIAEYLAEREDLSLFNEMVNKASKPRNYKNEYDSAQWQPVYDKEKPDSIVTWVPDSIAGNINYGALINARGNYTLLAPDNDAVNRYLRKHGYASVADIPEDVLVNVVDYHLLNTQISMTSQVTGTMNVADSTSIGLRHYVNAERGDTVVLDKVAKVYNKIPKETYNGYIYVISEVLEPHSNTLRAAMEETGRYDIMLEAFRKVKLDSTLLTVVRVPHRDSAMRANSKYEFQFNTVMAITDEAFNAAGVRSVADLQNKLTSGEWTDIMQDTAYANHWNADPDTLLKAYLLYHVLPGTIDWDRYGENIYYYGKNVSNMCENDQTMATSVREYFPNVLGYTIFSEQNGNRVSPEAVLYDGEGNAADVNYVNSDVYTKNGYIHEIDAPLMMVKNNHTVNAKIKYEAEDFLFSYRTLMGGEFIKNTPVAKFNTNVEDNAYLDVSSNQRYTTAKPNAGEVAVGKALSAQGSKQNMWYEMVVRDLAPSETGYYLVRLNYYATTNRTKNVLVYWRNARKEFDAVNDRMKISPLDLSNYTERVYYGERDSVTGERNFIEVPVYDEYQQDRLVGLVATGNEVADYAIRFLHVDANGAYYDSFTLEPCTEEQFRELQNKK